MQKIVNGDCLEVMKKYEANMFSSIVCDPPYGLKFMGKGWDHGVPGAEYGAEALRVTKPGGHLLAFGGTRTYHRLACAIEDAGWEIRDCIQWIYGSGFPKSHNNFGLEGYGTSLKPAYEPIIVAMKKCDGTFKQNAEKWRLGGINVDGCRVGVEMIKTCAKSKGQSFTSLGKGEGFEGCPETIRKGRWPANVILDEEAGKALDEQTGVLKSGANKPGLTPKKNAIYGKYKSSNPYGNNEANSGGASRFFYCAKASSSERGKENNHPTVKPLKLMKYLLKLVSPPENALILDPFCGSGSTILAAKYLGIDAIGIDKEEEYVKIAESRLSQPIQQEIGKI